MVNVLNIRWQRNASEYVLIEIYDYLNYAC